MYAWEQGSGMDEFDIAEGFRTVLDLVINYQQLCIFWTVNYNFENEPMRSFLLTQIRKKRCLCPGLPPRSELTQFPSVLFLP